MDWLLGLLNTTSKVLDLPSGKSFFLSEMLVLVRCIESDFKIVLIHRRTVVSIPCGPSALAVKEAAWGLARYAAISQVFLLQ